jgi:hypothetical protein
MILLVMCSLSSLESDQGTAGSNQTGRSRVGVNSDRESMWKVKNQSHYFRVAPVGYALPWLGFGIAVSAQQQHWRKMTFGRRSAGDRTKCYGQTIMHG